MLCLGHWLDRYVTHVQCPQIRISVSRVSIDREHRTISKISENTQWAKERWRTDELGALDAKQTATPASTGRCSRRVHPPRCSHHEVPQQQAFEQPRARCSQQACGGSAVLCVLISLLGIGIAATILVIDIPEQQESQQIKFRKVADEANLRLKSSHNDYEVSGLWVHQACRDRRMSFSEFRGVYQYITSTGLEFLEVSCALNASRSERLEYEKQSDAYLTSHYRNYYYRYIGCNGYERNPRTGEYDSGPMSNKSYR